MYQRLLSQVTLEPVKFTINSNDQKPLPYLYYVLSIRSV